MSLHLGLKEVEVVRYVVQFSGREIHLHERMAAVLVSEHAAVPL